MTLSVRERFEAKGVPEPNTGCWLWIGPDASSRRDYGCLTVAGKNVRAHRLAWELYRGPIPSGMVMDHICRVRCCVNPEHLRVVTYRQNAIENSVSITAVNRHKAHCQRGHPFTDENTFPRRKGRECRTCRRARKMGVLR